MRIIGDLLEKFGLLLSLSVYIIISDIGICQANGSESQSNIPEFHYYTAKKLYKSDSLNSSIHHYKIASRLYFEKRHWDSYLKCQIELSNIYFDQKYFDSTLFILNSSNEYLGNLPKERMSYLSGRFYYSKGITYQKLRQIDSSEFYLYKSKEICDQNSLDSLNAYVYKSLGNLNFSTANYDLALEFYKNSLEFEESISQPSDKLFASLFQNIGIIHSIKGAHDSAKVYFGKSITLKEKILPSNDPVLARGYMNYGRFLNTIGDQVLALEYLSKAELIYISRYGNDYGELAPIYLNIGSIFILLNDYDKALLYHERALEIYRKIHNSENLQFKSIYTNLGLIYERLDNIELAIDYFQRSLSIKDKYESDISALKNLANCYFRLGDTLKANNYYIMAKKNAEDLYGEDHFMTASAYLDYGVFCDNLGKFEEAKGLIGNALQIYTDNFGIKNRDVSNTLTSLGNHYNLRGDYLKAIEYHQLALISYLNDFDNKDIYSNPILQELEHDFNLFHTFYRKAFAFYSYYSNVTNSYVDLEATLNSCEIAINLFDNIKSTLGEENTKLAITTKINEIYNLGVTVSTQLYKERNDFKYLDLGFQFSEKVKAAVLLSMLNEFEALQISNIPDTIQQLDKAIKKKLAYYKNLIYEESQKSNPDEIQVSSWKKILFETGRVQDSLIMALEREYPDYYNLKLNNKTFSIRDIQNNLFDGEALIEYKVSDFSIISFYITKDTAFVSESTLSDSFFDEVDTYIRMMNRYSDRSQTREGFNDFIARSNSLYEILINPFILNSSIDKLYIIPDDVLGYLNFESLISEYDSTMTFSYKSPKYLIKSHTISYAYSGSLLFKESLNGKSKKSLLAMAPSYENVGDFKDREYASTRDIMEVLNPLEYTVEEVENVKSVYNGEILANGMATEANFKANAEKYNILHLAMHTIINDEEPLASKLVFTLDKDTIEDGFLNTHEIYNLDLNAKLAVLSACRTGDGALSKGEGIMSLARGFLHAGVPGIVMTLWAVEDFSSVEIMKGFYTFLKQGLNKDEALRQAKLSYLETANPQHSHPYFWAAYVQIGDNSSIVGRTNYSRIIYMAIIAFILVSGILLILRVRKRKSI